MANIKITELPGLSVLSSPNQFPVVSSGVTFNVTATVMQNFMSNVANAITVNSNNTATAIINGGTSGVGNIGAAGATFNTVFARATTAQYADVAELYVADMQYSSGTVLEFGGNYEVTATAHGNSNRIAGVVSTQPAYLMNSELKGQHIVPVALLGRVPCQVVGNIVKGDQLVSSNTPGVATSMIESEYRPGTVIGKALEAYNSDKPGVITIVVGRI